jgi:hypothetical protein
MIWTLVDSNGNASAVDNDSDSDRKLADNLHCRSMQATQEPNSHFETWSFEDGPERERKEAAG